MNGMDDTPQENNESQTCQQCDEYLNGWKRALADYDNLKKDLARQQDESRARLRISIALELIPILDHFDNALKWKPTGVSQEIEGWISGVLQVRAQLIDQLKSLGLEPFGEVGDRFDPHAHESTGERESETFPLHTVMEVIRRGWKHSAQIVRPAAVILSTRK